MPIQNDKVSLDFYQGPTPIQVDKGKPATKGHIYLETMHNNVFIGHESGGEVTMQPTNGVYKLNDTVIVDGTSLQVGNTEMTETELKSILAVSKLNLATESY